MELRTLRYFVVVARELNITRAAERLNMSQPPLSNQLKALEEELGVVLLDRSKKPVIPTEAGEVVLEQARSKDLSFFTSEEYTPEMERITAL